MKTPRIHRRRALQLAVVGAAAAALPLGLGGLAHATDRDSNRILVCIFLRGGLDGLSAVVPHSDPAYYAERTSIAVARPGADDGAIDLDGRFGLHPSLAPLAPLYRSKELAWVHAVGSPHASRSHFDAQDFMENGTPGKASTRDGWVNRALAQQEGSGLFRAVAVTGATPRSLAGSVQAMTIDRLDRFGLRGPQRAREKLLDGFSALYRDRSDRVSRTGMEALRALDTVAELDPKAYRPEGGAEYPRPFGQLRDVAQLIKADLGMQIAFVELGGWDTHARQAPQLARRLGVLARGLDAFRRDLGDRMENTLVLTMSEFGRTVAQNGSGGTDHGHATAMMLLGGGVRGGRVYGKWPGLAQENRFEGRDLEVTTDFRDLFGEVARKQLGARDLGRVFPGYSPDPKRWLGVLG